jgi:hypothetical protein
MMRNTPGFINASGSTRAQYSQQLSGTGANGNTWGGTPGHLPPLAAPAGIGFPAGMNGMIANYLDIHGCYPGDDLEGADRLLEFIRVGPTVLQRFAKWHLSVKISFPPIVLSSRHMPDPIFDVPRFEDSGKSQLGSSLLDARMSRVLGGLTGVTNPTLYSDSSPNTVEIFEPRTSAVPITHGDRRHFEPGYSSLVHTRTGMADRDAQARLDAGAKLAANEALVVDRQILHYKAKLAALEAGGRSALIVNPQLVRNWTPVRQAGFH